MTSVFRAIQTGGLAAGVVLAMSFAGGVSFAEPDSGAAPPSDPSAASQQAPPGTTADSAGGSSDSTPADSSPGMGQGPTSKVGNEPTVGVNGSGGAQTSSEDLQTQEDALSSNMANLADVTAQISADDQQLASKVAEMKLQGGDSLSIADMLEMQAIMEHMNEMSQLSSAIVSQSNAALAGMATKVKE